MKIQARKKAPINMFAKIYSSNIISKFLNYPRKVNVQHIQCIDNKSFVAILLILLLSYQSFQHYSTKTNISTSDAIEMFPSI